jgi:RNA recognition motif-containing protein
MRVSPEFVRRGFSFKGVLWHMNIYVGNLPFSTDDDKLRELFAAYGAVASATVIADKFTSRSRGFGFVEMDSTDEGRAAISALDGKELDGRALQVSEARPSANSLTRSCPGQPGG